MLIKMSQPTCPRLLSPTVIKTLTKSSRGKVPFGLHVPVIFEGSLDRNSSQEPEAGGKAESETYCLPAWSLGHS